MKPVIENSVKNAYKIFQDELQHLGPCKPTLVRDVVMHRGVTKKDFEGAIQLGLSNGTISFDGEFNVALSKPRA